jgi:hypothetical protein
VVGLAEASRWLCVGPFSVGMVGYLERGGEGDIMSHPSGSMFEVIGFDRGRGCEFDGRVARSKEQSSRKVAQTAEVVDSEGHKGDVVGIQGLDD